MILIEVIIAMALMMSIITLLLIFYSDIARVTALQEKDEETNFHSLFLATRLAAVLPKAVPFGSAPDAYFFTSQATERIKSGGHSLVFAFDNGPKLNPDIANHVIGRLYINDKTQLCLAIMPSPERWLEFESPKVETEILYENVDKMDLEFYTPPTRDRKRILTNNKHKFVETPNLILDPQGRWRQEWLQEYGDLPALVKITLTLKEGKPLVLSYMLPNSHLIITYDK
jgi:hypothetical protein